MIQTIALFFHTLFIPSEKNNYRSKVLHLTMLTCYILIAFSFTLFSRTFAFPRGQVLGVATDITTGKLFEETNQERIKQGLAPLVYNQRLEKAAYEKAKNMIRHHYWAHYGPDGTAPWDFILGAGYKYRFAGENLAKDFMFSDTVVKAWMDSPTHRDNILRREYTDIGFAIVDGNLDQTPTTLIVQMFGTPYENAPASRVLSASGMTTSRLPLSISKQTAYRLNIGFFAFLLLVLAADFYWAYKLRLVRRVGNHVAHGIFLIVAIAFFIIAAKGSIL